VELGILSGRAKRLEDLAILLGPSGESQELGDEHGLSGHEKKEDRALDGIAVEDRIEVRHREDGEDRKGDRQREGDQRVATDSVQAVGGTRDGIQGSAHGWILAPKAEVGSGIEMVVWSETKNSWMSL